MGHPENIGVIGLVAFEELIPRPRPFLNWKESDSSAKSARAESGGAGTGWGRDIESRVHRVPFVRSTNRRAVTIAYDTLDALRRDGVPVDRRPYVPFPADGDYCLPPHLP